MGLFKHHHLHYGRREDRRPCADSIQGAYMDTSTQQAAHQRKPSRLKVVFTWIGLVFFLIAALGNLISPANIGGALICIAFAIPFAWAIYCRRRDKKSRELLPNAPTQEYFPTHSFGTDPASTQVMPTLHPPVRTPRRWGRVATITVVVGLVGALMTPSSGPTDTEVTAAETSSPAPTTDNRAAKEAREAEESSARSSEAKKSEERKAQLAQESSARESERVKAEEEAARESERAKAEEEAREREAQAERDRVAAEEAAAEERERVAQEEDAAAERERVAHEQAAIAEQERIRTQQQAAAAPAPAPAPAPAASQSVTYKNCTDVWNRLGRPIHAGEPGYTAGPRKLDGNSDGVGCESDPR